MLTIESYWLENILEFNKIPFETIRLSKGYIQINLERPHKNLSPIRFLFRDDVLISVSDGPNKYEVNNDVTFRLDLERGFVMMTGLSNDEYCKVTGFMIDKPSDYADGIL